jgi:acetyl-CoA carboxylase biotin carboxyl carrier protein
VDPKEIRELVELISRSNVRRFELEREGFRLTLIKGEPAASVTWAGPHPPVESREPVVAVGANAEPPTESPGAGLYELHSPIVGTFYSAPAPDAPAFASVGERVKKGQTICIVEAMKVMNEIECEIDGEVVEMTVANGQPVEFGEVLFRLRPLA